MPHESPVAHTKHGDLSLDQIAAMQPGLGRLMLEVSERYWIMFHAAKGGNWGLAAYEMRNLRKTLQVGAQTRPRYAGDLADYDGGSLEPLSRAIRARDWPAFESAFRLATAEANRYHVRLGFAYIQWQLPPDPPRHLSIFPNEEVEKRSES